MKALFTLCLLLFISIPLFAVFQLLHRLEHNKVDKDADRKFYEALRQQYGLADPEPEPRRALTEDERIALAKRISDDPFADVKAEDVMEDIPEETKTAEAAAEKISDNASEGSEVKSPENTSSEQKGSQKSREEALAIVSAMMGSRNKKKGNALAELQDTLAKYRSQIEEKENNGK